MALLYGPIIVAIHHRPGEENMPLEIVDIWSKQALCSSPRRPPVFSARASTVPFQKVQNTKGMILIIIIINRLNLLRLVLIMGAMDRTRTAVRLRRRILESEVLELTYPTVFNFNFF